MEDTTVEQQITRELPHSIELTRNAKGDYQWAIKAYVELVIDLAVLPAQLEDIDQKLRDRFLVDETARLAEAFERGVEQGRQEQRQPLHTRA